MFLPIVAYGQSILRKVGVAIDASYPQLNELIADMWETMYKSNGVGLAAPQINKSIRLFVIDTIQIVEGFDEEDKIEYPNEKGVKKVFINAQIIEESGEEWAYNEGCLSIPKVREDVNRKKVVLIKYQDERFVEHTESFDGITARVIQHEYDHIEGKLFTELISPLRKRLLKRKLEEISRGDVDVSYKMKFVRKTR